MLKRCPNADHYRADLYGSLAMTGKGHLSDQIIIRKGLIDNYQPAPYNAFAGLETWTSPE